ncbi:MAG TPA: alpha-ribazole kinase [Pelotomaculum sp.]|nr:alpha-ribazole kinase [Pelotomaculum sp.]
MGYMGRDVEVVSLDSDRCLVAACDSCGAVGSKEFDAVKVLPYTVGRFTARVALLEVLATSARPLLITVASANEIHPTTEGVLQGVKDELRELDCPDLPMTISSEKNMLTQQTGLGISVVGICNRASLRIGASRPGDGLYCLGLPKVGSEVSGPDDPEIIRAAYVLTLLASPGVHDIVPVGSRGIRAEADSLAAHLERRFEPESDVGLDLGKSAGPATCLIFTCTPELTPPDLSPLPCRKIGTI